MNLGEITTLVLFGSRASGKERPNSDLDVGILCREKDSNIRRKLQSALAVELADLSPEGRVDVVFMDEAPVLLRQRIMESGILLLSKEPSAWKALRVSTMREFGDQEPYRRFFREAIRRRIEGGRFGGRSGRALESLERTGRIPR
jgi:predicted nucleotidyltransferase